MKAVERFARVTAVAMMVVPLTMFKTVVLAVVVTSLSSANVQQETQGLSSGLFLTFDNIHRVVCSGASLEADVDVMAMVLYRVADDRVLAYVNQAKQECTTSELFVSCDVDTTDSKRSRLSVLISDLAEGETRTLGCNISTIAAGGRFRTLSWRIVLRQASLTSNYFRGFHHIQEVLCTGEPLPPDSDLLSMVMFDSHHKNLVAVVNLRKRECFTSHSFISCEIHDTDSRRTRLRALVLDLPEGQARVFGCNLTTLAAGGLTNIVTWSLVVTGAKTTTTTTQSTTTTSTTTLPPEPATPPPRASGVKSKLQEFQLPVSVIIIGLVLLIFFAALCVILIILQCRGRRRRRSRAANRESLLSARNEPVGGGGYRTTRSTTTFPAPGMPPDGSGGNLAMRYQKSIPGYVSGSSVYYSEPYGTLDDEMKERLRPNPRMCHIPYDIKGGPLDPHAQAPEHSA
ncbi:uncharacterized protein LOC112568945 isoform X2 [Pomacea canaliculata]|uniref:uncharacterized protein LOC112568945 isoform X2 n=1 Tax=Pomacea canaliculata TaxID=400727 RepID=UPI000D735A28|nr:uncharacterized protein LOC112568945 isoform X2 [Pomacea canaliculata]